MRTTNAKVNLSPHVDVDVDATPASLLPVVVLGTYTSAIRGGKGPPALPNAICHQCVNLHGVGSVARVSTAESPVSEPVLSTLDGPFRCSSRCRLRVYTEYVYLYSYL